MRWDINSYSTIRKNHRQLGAYLMRIACTMGGARRRMKLTQKQLAALLGCKPGKISYIESQASISLDMAKAYIDLLEHTDKLSIRVKNNLATELELPTLTMESFVTVVASKRRKSLYD